MEYTKYDPPGAQVSDDTLAQKYLLYTPPSRQKRKIWVRKAGIHGRIFSLSTKMYPKTSAGNTRPITALATVLLPRLGDCRNSIFSLFLPFLAKKVVPDSRFSDARFFQGRLFDFLQKIGNGWPANRSRSGRAARFFFVLFQISYVFLRRVNPVGGNCR